jgi:hypothetical protein
MDSLKQMNEAVIISNPNKIVSKAQFAAVPNFRTTTSWLCAILDHGDSVIIKLRISQGNFLEDTTYNASTYVSALAYRLGKILKSTANMDKHVTKTYKQ